MLLMLLSRIACSAQTVDDDSAALSLADRSEAPAPQVYDWRSAFEVARVHVAQSDGLPDFAGERLAGDARYDGAISAAVRGVVSDRLDVDWLAGAAAREVNTLREAFFSWRAAADVILDAGRINVRSGTAFGYNPTDFWRTDAVRQTDSLDPDSLRANRLGSVMLRGQTLWNAGSMTLLVSPRLANAPSAAPFSLDLGATNRRNRWSLAVSQRLASNLTPQLLLYEDGEGGVQAGLNMTYLVNPSTIAYLEWSGGRRSRLASGLTLTTAFRLSVTVEYESNSAALDRSAWDQLRYGDPQTFRRYLEFAAGQQELVTQHAFFSYAQIADCGWRHFDVAAFSRLDLEDHSRLDWIEARYHWPKLDLALQAQQEAGSPRSAFGASPQRRVLQLVFDYYFP